MGRKKNETLLYQEAFVKYFGPVNKFLGFPERCLECKDLILNLAAAWDHIRNKHDNPIVHVKRAKKKDEVKSKEVADKIARAMAVVGIKQK